MLVNLLKISIPTAMAFFLGLLVTPIATHFFFKYKMWKKHSRNGNGVSEHFQKIHLNREKEELNTPRVGGMIIWISVLITTLIVYLMSVWYPTESTVKMNFLSRNQTLIPFFTLIIGSLIGLWDDMIQIYGHGKFAHDAKSWRVWKAFLIALVSFFIGYWFYYKLGMNSVHIPFDGELYIGWLIIPFFMIVSLAVFSGGVIDGLDGLSGGVLASIFSAYAVMAYSYNQVDLAAFCGAVAGAIFAFLWFNIPPARFFMGETGIMGLTITLATIAFLTNSVLLLPIVALPLAATSFSVLLQMFSRKFMKEKIFIIAPLHHHFEAIGWPTYKVTMRYWILSVMFAIIGVILAVVS
jgi:phospho-N-acetylmuramoyl-pentapeptide-transferase